jgi:hypothetical protein
MTDMKQKIADAVECRRRGSQCEAQAARSWGALQVNFLSAAKSWSDLADDLERLEKTEQVQA